MAILYDDTELEAIIDLVISDADERENNAAYSGQGYDGGAEILREMVHAFRCGMRRQIPAEWEKYAYQARQERDPEWAEYQRLKEKFSE